MKKTSVYIETTIPSYYYKTHDSRVKMEHEATVKWWDSLRHQYDLYTSIRVLAELKRGRYPDQDKIIALVEPLPLLPTVQEIDHIASVYIRDLVMPKGKAGDAAHLAYASYYQMNFLLTWNCEHIANPNKFQHIRIINAKMGLSTPELVTPYPMVKASEGKNED